MATLLARTPTLRHGADGWRTIAGDGFMPAVADLAYAAARALRHRFGPGTLLVGHDARRDSSGAAAVAAAAVDEAGMDTLFAGPVATPLAAFAVRRHRLHGAILITASHNPAPWNGVKVKIAPGLPPDADFAADVEAIRAACVERISFAPANPPSRWDSRATRDEFIESAITATGFSSTEPTRVAVDGLGGVGGPLLARTLRAAGVSVIAAGCKRDWSFGGLVPDPMEEKSRARLGSLAVARDCALGMAVDGDGDRLGVVRADGTFVPPHDVLALLTDHLDLFDGSPGALGLSVNVGSLPRRVARSSGREVLSTPVGFKHIAPLMCDGRVTLGGGGVGDVGFRFRGPDRDPCAAALALLRLLQERQQSLAESVDALHRQHGRTVHGALSMPWRGSGDASLEAIGRRALAGVGFSLGAVEHLDGVKFIVDDVTWLLLREGTTEPVVRVCAETSSAARTQSLLTTVRQILREET